LRIEIFCCPALRALAFVLLLPEAVTLAVIQKGSPAAPASENPDVKRLVSEFTAGEAELATAFNHYGYKFDVLIQSIKNGKVTGEFHRITQVSLNQSGKPEERVVSFPASTLTEVIITPEDLENFSGNSQFAFDPAHAGRYEFKYVSKETINGAEAYVLEVKHKGIGANERLFKGRIWVNPSNSRIVRMRGKFEQQSNQRFPVMDTFRTAVDGQYMFPSHGSADEEVTFQVAGRIVPSVHLRVEVRYTDYVKQP